MYESRMQCMPLTYKIQLEFLEGFTSTSLECNHPKWLRPYPLQTYLLPGKLYTNRPTFTHTHSHTHTSTYITHSPTTGTYTHKHKLWQSYLCKYTSFYHSSFRFFVFSYFFSSFITIIGGIIIPVTTICVSQLLTMGTVLELLMARHN